VIAAPGVLILVPRGANATLVSVRTCDGATIALNADEERVLELHNRARTRRGLKALCVHPALTEAARPFAGDARQGLRLPQFLQR
jgi:uncharacterized protein YkwD